MKMQALAAALLAASATMAVAQTPGPDAKSVPDKVQKTQPGATSGSTADPTAKPPQSGNIADEEMKDQPAATSGSTAEPTAQPKTDELSDKAKQDLKAPN